jgi:thioredoxin-like negative regulator of GroEL
VDSKDPIPLNEAIDRGLMPCASCGRTGATLRKAGKGDALLCAPCAAKGGTWTWVLAGLTFAVVALVILLLQLRTHPAADGPPTPPLPPHARDPEPWMKETLRLMEMKRYADARVRIAELLEPLPKQPELNLLMGRCLMSLRAYDAALPYLKVAYDAGGAFRDEGGLRLGLCYKTIGHAAQALPYLEPPSGGETSVRGELAEVYLDLERYDDALKLLPEPSGSGALWGRHRALVYQGQGDAARKLLEGRPDAEVATLRAGQLREDGDFAGARKILDAYLAALPPGSPDWPRAQRSLLSLAVESGDLPGIAAVASALAADKDPQVQGEAAFARALGHLLAGRREQAKAAAWEFLAKTDKDFSPNRLERMMMRHLAGELKTADLEAEAKLVSRFHANDLLWYLALESGDRARAEQALAATPGHNYPYHSIRRLLKP